MGSRFKLALIQLSVGSNKSDNLVRAANKISEAVSRGANIVSLPGKVTSQCTAVFVSSQLYISLPQNVLTPPMVRSISKSTLRVSLMVLVAKS